MSQTIVLFHSALGLRPAVLRFADALRAAGHTVHTPDLYGGEVFDNLDDGVRKGDALGVEAVVDRASAAVAALPNEVVYAGFSLGSLPAEYLAAKRPGARGAILLHGGLSLEMFDLPAWPAVPVQIHYANGDPWVEPPQIESLSSDVRKAGQRCDVFVYDEGGHLFADDEFADYSKKSAELMRARVLEFLAAL